MAVLFSAVTLTADNNQVEFLAAGVPRDADDLEGWTAYELSLIHILDATHSPVFNQIEGLVIDKGITFADLKGVINSFLRQLYGENTKTKFRPGFFPFTEPSAEVDATCSLCGGKGCPACKGAGMVEVLGCGMVNPKVLENCGLDPEIYSGYAFGLGLDRLTNIKYGITDIRLLYESDVRFLRQFK